MKPAPNHDHSPSEPAAKTCEPVGAEIKNQSAHTPADREQLLLNRKFTALNQLSAGIAHEFNNVIAGVLGSAELAAMDIHEGHPAHPSLRQIFEASQRGREFLHKVRTFSLRPPVELKIISLPALVEETIQILRGLIPEKVVVQSHINPDCPAVLADAAQIHQALLDLCLHSWQNLHERRGQLTVSLKFGRLPPNAAVTVAGENAIHLIVRDDGPGLDKSGLAKIFDPFHTRRSSAKKIGLELFAIREIVHAHHGEIIVESEPGHGVAFHIYLPLT